MAKFDFRHGIARYQEDGVGNPNFLQKSGNFISLLVQPDPTVFLIAHYDENYIYTENVTVNEAWGPYTGTATRWMYWDVDFITGVLSRGQTLLEPLDQAFPPPNPLLDQHWFDMTQAVQKRWNGSAWVDVLRLFAGKLVNGSVLIQYPLGSQVGMNGIPTYAGFPLVDPEGMPVQKFRRDRKGQFITSETPLAAQFSRNANFRVEAAITQAEAHENIPVHHCVAYNGYNTLLLARNNVPDLPAIGIAAEDMNTGEVRSFITKGFVTNDVDWDWSAYDAGTSLFVGPTGQLTVFPSQSGGQQNMGFIVDQNTVFINPQQIIEFDTTGNLVPLQLDKATGALVAGEVDTGTPPGTFVAFGYVHLEFPATQIWTVTHNAGTDKVVAQIYDSANEQVFPNNITILDVNTVQIDFVGDQEGRAHLILFA